MSTRIKTIELFLALGFATAVGTQTLPSGASEIDGIDRMSGESTSATHWLLAEGGEGEGGEGEGGEGAVGTGDPNIDYMTVLGLMKGHLAAAQELIKVKNYEQAEPHIGHPVEELYSQIEIVLPQKGVSDFKPTLNQLHDLALSAPDSPEMQTLFAQSIASIDEAIAAVPETQRTSPDFVLSVMVEMLNNAAAEYKAAIANNKFVEIVEYQDSRGFVFYAEELYQTIAAQNSKTNPEGHKVITDSLAELKTAWPTIEPPAAPIKQPGEVQGLVTQIEFNK